MRLGHAGAAACCSARPRENGNVDACYCRKSRRSGSHWRCARYVPSSGRIGQPLFRRQRRAEEVVVRLNPSEIEQVIDIIAYQRQMTTLLYEGTLNTTSCSRACSITFRPKSSFGPTSVTDA